MQAAVAVVQGEGACAAATSGYTVTVDIASGGGVLSGATSVVTVAAGTATFAGLSITGLIGARTLSFSATSLTGATSGTITLAPGAATQLTITTQPPARVALGAVFVPQPVIQIRDAAGNALSQSGTTDTAAIATGPATLSGTNTAVTNASGVATFLDRSFTVNTGVRTLNVSAPGLTGATSTAISVP